MKKHRDCLLKAVRQILDEIGFENYKVSKRIPKDMHTDLLTTVGFTGDISANLMIQTDLASGDAFVRQSAEHLGVDIKDEKDFGNFHKATIAEIANQIAGRSVSLLAEAGYDCNITPPTIISGSNVFISSIGMKDTVTRIISGKFGKIKIYAGFKRIGSDN